MNKKYIAPQLYTIDTEINGNILYGASKGDPWEDGGAKKHTGSSFNDFSDDDEDGFFYKKYTVKW